MEYIRESAVLVAPRGKLCTLRLSFSRPFFCSFTCYSTPVVIGFQITLFNKESRTYVAVPAPLLSSHVKSGLAFHRNLLVHARVISSTKKQEEFQEVLVS